MSGKQVTFKPTDEVVERFEQLFEDAKNENRLLSKPKFFEMLVNGYSATKYEDASQDVDFMKSQIEKYQVQFLEICDLLNLDEANNTHQNVLNEIRATQQRAMMALQTQEVPTEQNEPQPRPLAENEIMFTIPDVHMALMKEVTRRLSTPESTVTIKDILLDMFLRYEVQRYNEWFYPMVIKDEEFKQITGYERKELKKLCQD